MPFTRIAGWILAGLLASLSPVASAQDDFDEPVWTETEAFVAGFVRFVAYHEAGHLIMHQLAGMQTDPYWSKGELEDYADQFALVLLEPDAQDETGVEEILNAAAGWLQVDNNIAPNDPHAPPHDRALDIVCLLYGSDPAGFANLQELTAPDANCVERYQEMDAAIEEAFRAQTEEMGLSIDIVYADASDATFAAQQFLIESEIVEDLKDDLEADFNLTHQTTIQAINCKGRFQEDTFHFNTVSKEFEEDDHYVITLCYEMIDMRLKHGMKGFE